jgi:hypothetical protein
MNLLWLFSFQENLLVWWHQAKPFDLWIETCQEIEMQEGRTRKDAG